MTQTNLAKKHAGHGFTQFKLTQNLLNNLQQFEVSPSAKLVLLYLSTCYNPKKADMFPKQKTIAAKIGISEASVIRAISELHKQGLIISERKYTNRYKFTSKIVPETADIENSIEPEKIFEPKKMQVEKAKNESNELANCNLPCIEPIKEQNIEQQKRVKEINSISETIKIDEYKLLKKYAVSKGAKNVQKYVNALIINGSAKEIIKAHKEKLAIEEYHRREILRTQELIAKQREDFDKAVKPTECEALRKVLREKFGRKQ